MKIKILKESRKKQEQLEEALRDYILGGTLALGNMFGGAKSAQAGVEGYSPETVELATCSGGAIHGVGKTGFLGGKYGSKSKGCNMTGVVSADTMIIKCGSSTSTLSK